MSQYGSQQYGQGQSQQDPSAAGANGYGDQSQGGYGGQDQGQDPSQGGYGQDQSQQDPSAGYGQQDANQAGGDPDSQQNGYGQQDANQAGGDPDSQQNGYGGQDQSQQSQGQMKGGAGAVAKKQQGGAVQKRQNPKHAHYSESHHNALHHAGQVAKSGFTAQHMDAALQLGMYAMGSLANTHGLAPEAPHPGQSGQTAQ